MTMPSRNISQLDHEVTDMVIRKVKNCDDTFLLKVAEFMFGTDDDTIKAYREAIQQEYAENGRLGSVAPSNIVFSVDD